MNARDRPGPKRFYAIELNEDDTVDVYLIPSGTVYETDIGIKEYDVDVRVVRGIVPWKGIEDDIRAHFEAWCESGEAICI